MKTRRIPHFLAAWPLCVPLVGGACSRGAPEPSDPSGELARSATPQNPEHGTRSHGAETPLHGEADHAAEPPASAPSARGEPGYAKDFSAVERFASHFDDPKRDAWQKPHQVIELLELHQGHTVADIGAGTGYFEAALSRAVGPRGRVLALDAEPKMVEHLRQRAAEEGLANVAERPVDPEDPGLPSASVDRILIVNTWHHISDRVRYAQKLLEALRPGGAVLVVDFTESSDIGPPPAHRLAPERVVEELTAAGFQATLVDESLPKQYVVQGRREP